MYYDSLACGTQVKAKSVFTMGCNGVLTASQTSSAEVAARSKMDAAEVCEMAFLMTEVL